MPDLETIARYPARLATGLAKFLLRLYHKQGPRYWIGAAAMLIVTTLIEPYVGDYLDLVRVRYWMFQNLSQLEWRPLVPRFVKVVLVDDKEHWGSELQGVVPIKRDYVARLVDRLSQMNARVIAIDFDMRLNDPDAKGTVGDFAEISPDTQAGVHTLINSIARAADAGHHVVLSRTILFGGPTGYRLAADIYQPYGICTALNSDGSWQSPGFVRPDATRSNYLTEKARRNIDCGYIALPYDMRLLPPRIYVAGDQPINSFAFAIAKATNPAIAENVRAGAYYGTYIPGTTLEKYKVTVPASLVRTDDTDAAEEINGNAVIVGAQWHEKALGQGDMVDTWMTPIGPVTGAVIHENFAEAILDSRVFGYVPNWLLRALEFGFSIFCAILFALYDSVTVKLVAFAALSVGLVVVQWLMLQIFGTFFEAFVPLFGLGLHSVVERLVGHR